MDLTTWKIKTARGEQESNQIQVSSKLGKS